MGLELRELAAGGRACLAFTTVDKLVAALGPWQPWVGLRAADLRAHLERLDVDEVHVDSGLPADAWRWDEHQIQAVTDGVIR